MRKTFEKIIPLLLLTVFLAACAPAAVRPTQRVAPSPVRATAAPGSLSFGSVSLTSSGQSPNYTIQTDVPVLQGVYSHRDEFNLRLSGWVQQRTEAFKKNLANWTPVPDMPGSSFTLSYLTFPYNARFASIQLIEDTYLAGAAHPSHQITSLVYDIETAQDVTLEQLFLPDSEYLQVIAEYCKAELSKREIGYDDQQHGADPTPENYAVWNLSSEGLVITFNEYQVAAYAAGPQKVTVPWGVLKAILSDDFQGEASR